MSAPLLTVRPIADSDAAAFKALHGRCDDAAVRGLVRQSQAAFELDGPGPQRRVFVLHDGSQLLGAATLAGSIGLDLPRSSFRAGVVVHASAELKLFNRADTLVLSNDTTGCAEIGVPLMASADSLKAPQRLLIDAMLLHVAAQPDAFARVIVSQLPGVTLAGGASLFWNGLGRHFHAGDVPPHDSFFPSAERSHIARLLPKHPLYSSFLGAEAQACIGQRATSARVVAEALQAQGFRYRGHVGIFDGGPIVEADVADLHAVRGSLSMAVRIEAGEHARACLVAPMHRPGHGASLVLATLSDGALCVAPGTASVLGVEAGQRVRVLPQGMGHADPA